MKATIAMRFSRLLLVWTALVSVACTKYGVPHIRATSLAALGFGDAYLQSADYGARVALSLLRARGEMSHWFGRDSVAEDFAGRLEHARPVEV